MSLITDLATITTIPISTLEKLFEKEQLCILHRLYENEKAGEHITNMDIGIGNIYINHCGDELKYKFIPSKSFENNLINIINSGKSPLIDTVENTLSDRIINTYKDLI